MNDMKTDEQVYIQLIKDKSKRQSITIAVLAFLLVVFIVATIVLAVLYFGEGSLVEDTEVRVYTDGGYILNSNINTTNSATNGDVTIRENNSPIMAICIVCGVTVFCGFLCLLYYIRKQKS